MTRRFDPAALDPEWPFELNATPVSFAGRRAGLLVVDLQAADMTIAPESPLAQRFPGDP